MHYKLIVNNLANITASHVHLAAKGVNGPVVVFLYPGPQIPALLAAFWQKEISQPPTWSDLLPDIL